MKLGLISDTHNYLDPRVLKIFDGVDHILHAGDVGQPMLLVELEQIAPVTAVLGNTDEGMGLSLRLTERIELGRKNFLIHHIVTPGAGPSHIPGPTQQDPPDVVMFGHTHKPFAQQFGRTLFFNPGYAGRQRFDLKRSVALMEISAEKIAHNFVNL
jgi:putative phosphoesterase